MDCILYRYMFSGCSVFKNQAQKEAGIDNTVISSNDPILGTLHHSYILQVTCVNRLFNQLIGKVPVPNGIISSTKSTATLSYIIPRTS